jgi:hypothetical protein
MRGRNPQLHLALVVVDLTFQVDQEAAVEEEEEVAFL